MVGHRHRDPVAGRRERRVVQPPGGHELRAGCGRTLLQLGQQVLVAGGGAAPGHEDLLTELEERAAAAGTQFVATGWLDDAALAAACHRVAVPVAYHRHVSASGSVNSWLAAGRRPVVVLSLIHISEPTRRS